MSDKSSKGFSLIETLVAIALFAVIATISTQVFATVLRNSRKSQSIGEVRENVDYAINTMERLLRNATDLDCSASSTKKLVYIDEYNTPAYFECLDNGSGNYYIASGSAATIPTPVPVRLTSEDVSVTNCNIAPDMFFCTEDIISDGIPPDSVKIVVKAQDSDYEGTEEGAVVTSQTQVNLRVYK